jgi:beta-phosphoglucomutase-like phosphatase (HAD superfamily)
MTGNSSATLKGENTLFTHKFNCLRPIHMCKYSRINSSSLERIRLFASGGQHNEFHRDYEYAGDIEADYLSLANPLERLNRLGTNWFGVICELEGVVIPDLSRAHQSAWYSLALQERLQCPVEYELKHFERFKADQLISQVFNWSHNTQEINRLTMTRQAIFNHEIANLQERVLPGTIEFLELLASLKIPCVFLSQEKRTDVNAFLKNSALQRYLSIALPEGRQPEITEQLPSLITAEDVRFGLPDTESLLLGSRLLNRPLDRTIVIGSSLQTLEASRDLDMRCVMLRGKYKSWELYPANLVVSSLDELCFQNLKNLLFEV